MANIEKRKSESGRTTYRVKVRLKGHPTQSASFERLTDARKWAQHVESAIREGRHFKTTEAKRHTLADLIDRYTKTVLPRKPKVQRDQASQLRWWKGQLGNYTLADVSAKRISESRDVLAVEVLRGGKCRAPATVNRYLAALSHAFTVAVNEWEWLESNPLAKVSKLSEPRGRVRYLTDGERPRLLDACKESQCQVLYLVVVLALSTGARKGEILSLRWPQVSLGRRRITLEDTKNGERRVLPLAGHAFDLLEEYSQVRRLDTDLVFPAQKSQKSLDIRAAWENALKRAGIEDFRFHDLRHSAASYLAMNGATLTEIAEILGHKTLQMVKRYSHLSEDHTAQVVSNMNEKIFG